MLPLPISDGLLGFEKPLRFNILNPISSLKYASGLFRILCCPMLQRGDSKLNQNSII